jgi:hypothetical protein
VSGQSSDASIGGVVIDSVTQIPVSSAVVLALREGLPPFSGYSKSGGAGEFRIDGLEPGTYKLCIQAGIEYLDPCDWGTPTTLILSPLQVATEHSLVLSRSSLVNIDVQDQLKLLKRTFRSGRRPAVLIGVTGPNGLYLPARPLENPSASVVSGLNEGEIRRYVVAVPSEVPFSLHVASPDLRLQDEAGSALPGRGRAELLIIKRGEGRSRKLVFKILGTSTAEELLP